MLKYLFTLILTTLFGFFGQQFQGLSPLSPTQPVISEASPAPRKDSYLNPVKQDYLTYYLEDLTPEAKASLDAFFEPYNLDEKQREVVLFLALAWHGFTIPIDDSTTRYYSAWHDYTFEYPSDWLFFPGDPGRIGVLAPETNWQFDPADENNSYGVNQVEADIFFHAYCQNSSLEPPHKWTSLDDFISKTKKDLLFIYNYPPTTGPEEAVFAKQTTQKYIMKPKPIIIDYHFFESTELGTVYSLDYRYHPERGEKYLATINQIADSFNTGEIRCDYYDSKFTEQPLIEILYDFFDYLQERSVSLEQEFREYQN